ncbi:MAG: four helix bundle protein [Candidatus Omnitrophica bacterium]|nr:four helix bundle protein [Candidatus Omnitrophota bacterium]
MATTEKKEKLKTYKDLIAWQKAYSLCFKIYEMTKSFPVSEQYGLTSQIKRSALSIPSNIAEGYTRHGTQDYIRFLYIAYASLAELETQLLLAKDLKYFSPNVFDEVISLQMEVQRIMHGLIIGVKRKIQKPVPL